MNRKVIFTVAALVASVLAACNDSPSPLSPTTSPAFAQGGGGGGIPAPSRCGSIVVTNNPQSVRRSVMPDIKFNVENCGTVALSLTVTITETEGFLSVLCPSPVASPISIALNAKQKVSATAPVYRGPCGTTGPVNGTFVDGSNRWQGHNLLLTLTDDATGVVYGSAPFNWQDVFVPGI
ncbi:MAG: hypothetical protein ABI625_11560 [bacterium]